MKYETPAGLAGYTELVNILSELEDFVAVFGKRQLRHKKSKGQAYKMAKYQREQIQIGIAAINNARMCTLGDFYLVPKHKAEIG